MTARERPDYLPTLDGWRAVAALATILIHASFSIEPTTSFWEFWKNYGYFGVPIFFAISGLLITTRLLQTLRERGDMDFKGFYIRRALRIFPAAWLCLAVTGLLGAAGVLPVRPGQCVSALLFFRNYWQPQWYTWHFWTLSVEEHFYVLWPAILAFCGPRRALRASVLLALGIAAWRFLQANYMRMDHWLYNPPFFFCRTDIRLDNLFWGCWMALLLDIPLWRQRLTRWLSLPVWLGLIGLVIAYTYTKTRPYMLCQALFIPLILAGTMLRPRELPGRILELAPLRWIGRLSYSIYLWQELFTGQDGRLGALGKFPLNIPLIFLAAALSYYLVEKPAIRLGRRLAKAASPRYTTGVHEPAHTIGAQPGVSAPSGPGTA